VIRQVDPADPATGDALVALQRAAYAVEAALIGADVIPAMQETAADLARSRLTFLATAEDGALVAMLAYARDGTTVDIHRLVVHPDAFRRGHATRLLSDLEEREPDAAVALVATAAANAPALALYRRHGFAQIGRRTVSGGIEILELERRSGC
jgi:ribosomal protein S18 acetylase RimI-like enzyme